MNEYDVYDEVPNDPIHDIIINIQSFSNLKDGWEIKYQGDKERIICLSKEKRIRIAIFGNTKYGKTFILQKNIKKIFLWRLYISNKRFKY